MKNSNKDNITDHFDWKPQYRIIKIGCDFQHSWDAGQDYDVNYIIEAAKTSIDSWYKLVPAYGAEKEAANDEA